ncbi:DUF4037 domain-containing protein [Kribbella sp. NPDC026596]|uniref:DUF4037 domain-containing protein n=1 Tax=Kribbella sp. NPDC026596 TaxID=3155122 RepID=UPI003410D156
MPTDFVSGQEMSRRFYSEAVRPVLDTAFPGLPHSAALLGRGSEVLGYDDAMSSDHNWEPRVQLFLRDEDHVRHADAVTEALRQKVPARFADHDTEFGVYTLSGYFQQELNFDLGQEITARDWLTFSEQNLSTVTAGAVFHDEVGLAEVRERFAYYPRDVWLYLLVAGWWRVHPEVNLVGRTGFVGDELGSGLIGARLVRELMHLCFLLERKYAPYPKWFGTAFSRLSCGPSLGPILRTVLRAESWQDREAALMTAYEEIGRNYNSLQITPAVELGIEQMCGRPFKVVWGDYVGPLAAEIKDPAVREIAERWPVGGIDQLREIMWPARWRGQLLAVFDTAR